MPASKFKLVAASTVAAPVLVVSNVSAVTVPLAVIAPVILMLPVPVTSLLLRSKFPPSCGVVSVTTSPPPLDCATQS